jgi:hypothetical protein
MREYNFFTLFKVMALKIHFLSESRSVKILIAQNLVSNRLMIILRSLLFYFIIDL